MRQVRMRLPEIRIVLQVLQNTTQNNCSQLIVIIMIIPALTLSHHWMKLYFTNFETFAAYILKLKINSSKSINYVLFGYFFK